MQERESSEAGDARSPGQRVSYGPSQRRGSRCRRRAGWPLAPGDPVYAAGLLNPKGGLYAEYAALRSDLVAPIPRQRTTEQAGVPAGVGITALRGLDDTLGVRPGE
jgi:NADPH:quinone reductase-like Zn-dependent oxidoreductase